MGAPNAGLDMANRSGADMLKDLYIWVLGSESQPHAVKQREMASVHAARLLLTGMPGNVWHSNKQPLPPPVTHYILTNRTFAEVKQHLSLTDKKVNEWLSARPMFKGFLRFEWLERSLKQYRMQDTRDFKLHGSKQYVFAPRAPLEKTQPVPFHQAMQQQFAPGYEQQAQAYPQQHPHYQPFQPMHFSPGMSPLMQQQQLQQYNQQQQQQQFAQVNNSLPINLPPQVGQIYYPYHQQVAAQQANQQHPQASWHSANQPQNGHISWEHDQMLKQQAVAQIPMHPSGHILIAPAPPPPLPPATAAAAPIQLIGVGTGSQDDAIMID